MYLWSPATRAILAVGASPPVKIGEIVYWRQVSFLSLQPGVKKKSWNISFLPMPNNFIHELAARISPLPPRLQRRAPQASALRVVQDLARRCRHLLHHLQPSSLAVAAATRSCLDLVLARRRCPTLVRPPASAATAHSSGHECPRPDLAQPPPPPPEP